MRRRIVGAIALFAMITVACTAGGGSTSVAPVDTASGATHTPVTLNVWSFYTGHEFTQYQSVLADFSKLYPWITINHTPSKSDQDYLRAVNSNSAPDIAISPGPDNVAKFCDSGAYTDLTQFLQQDGTDISSIVPAAALRYTSYQGNQCTLPVLTDAYGLYYNKDMFAAAHITTPPKTLSELETDAKKLTVFNPDGSIKIAGFMPSNAFYESYALYQGVYSGSQWYDESGKSALASDPSWASLYEWQKKFTTDVYGPDGYQKLKDFFASLGGPNSEWGANTQGFETGQLAMAMDGEWRTAFITTDKAKVNYETAPFPVLDSAASLYGAGTIGGDVIGIPSNAEHKAEAWLLLKYLALDTGAEEKLAETLGNVPTTFDALKDPKLTATPHFQTFLDIFANPNSAFKPITVIGQADSDALASFLDDWEAGKVPDLHKGLEDLAAQIDQQFTLG
jgi:multiple sugar transport system substrate-binding protein